MQESAYALQVEPSGQSTRLPVVLTSLNPFARLDHQLACLSAWRKLGFETLSFNCPEERLRLAEAGVPSEALLQATEEETGLALFGKPVPRVARLLARIAQMRPGRSVMLVNSDIYPAATWAGFADLWLDRASALALTREETTGLDCTSDTGRLPYRGGLDAFVLGPAALAAVNADLAARPVSERMCFGIPGWDFLLGALIAAPRIGGRIMDSGILLHEAHRTTYSDIDEFAHYVPDIAGLTGMAQGRAQDVAHAFATMISERCEAETGGTALVRALHYRRPVPGAPGPAAVAAARWLMGLSPALRWNHNLVLLALLADRVGRDPACDLSRTLCFFTSHRHDRKAGVIDVLAAALLILRMRARDPGSDAYPPGNLHARALEIIIEGTARDPLQRQLEITRLFCDELVNYGIFNPRLYNFLALACRNDDERRLLAEIAARAWSGRRADAA